MTNKDTPIKLKMETEVYLYPMIAEQKRNRGVIKLPSGSRHQQWHQKKLQFSKTEKISKLAFRGSVIVFLASLRYL